MKILPPPAWRLLPRSAAALALLLLTAALARAASPEFDAWADQFAARWARLNPQDATRAQYFSGAEQDAIDRELGLSGTYSAEFGVKAAQVRAAVAREGLAALQGFPAAGLRRM